LKKKISQKQEIRLIKKNKSNMSILTKFKDISKINIIFNVLNTGVNRGMAILTQIEIDNFKKNGPKNGKSNKNSGIMLEADAKRVLDAIITVKSIKNNKNATALALVTGLGQAGAANKNIGNMNYHVAGETDSDLITLTNTELNNAIKSIDKNSTPRQFFRAIRDDLQVMAVILSEPGDLSRLIVMDLPNLSNEELTWASNFQTHNPNCPKEIADWLIQNHNTRFEKK
jgi:hypothetical protein